eukprot:56562-Eustigmatos_ZCMA.PRE.1
MHEQQGYEQHHQLRPQQQASPSASHTAPADWQAQVPPPPPQAPPPPPPPETPTPTAGASRRTTRTQTCEPLLLTAFAVLAALACAALHLTAPAVLLVLLQVEAAGRAWMLLVVPADWHMGNAHATTRAVSAAPTARTVPRMPPCPYS